MGGRMIRLRGALSQTSRSVKLAKQAWKYYGAALICSVGISLAQLAVPYLRKVIIDDVLISRNITLIWAVVGIFVGALVLSIGLGIVQQFLVATAEGTSTREMRSALFEHLRKLPVGLMPRYGSGRASSLFIQDVDTACHLHRVVLIELPNSLFRCLVGLVIIFLIDFRLALALAIFSPLVVLAPILFSQRIQQSSRHLRDVAADVFNALHESMGGTKEILAFRRENWDVSRMREFFGLLVPASVRVALLRSYASNASLLVGWAPTLILFAVGSLEVLRGNITIGMLFAFAGYLDYLTGPIKKIGSLTGELPAGVGASGRIFEFLDLKPESRLAMSNGKRISLSGGIEFRNVYFSYEPGRPALRSVSFKINPGEHVALVGPSGAGKSTIINLLIRFHDPQKGCVLFSGFDAREIAIDCLRSQMAVVFQNPFIFADTVLENLRFAKPDATMTEIEQAARLAHAHQFISRLPQRYHTDVSERGFGLSEGQKQRMAIARAILVNPRILILDEATAFVDPHADWQIQQALTNLLQERTTITIAHRLSTVAWTDKVICLNEGEVVGIGSHKELIEHCKIYRDFYIASRSGEAFHSYGVALKTSKVRR